jgi:glycine dehydrogenase subunit 1
LQRLARINHANAVRLAERLEGIAGVRVVNEFFFNEFTLELEGDAAEVVERMAAQGVLGGVPLSRLLPGNETAQRLLVVANTEVNTDEDREAFVAALRASL